jgi:hypothetical protein
MVVIVDIPDSHRDLGRKMKLIGKIEFDARHELNIGKTGGKIYSKTKTLPQRTRRNIFCDLRAFSACPDLLAP